MLSINNPGNLRPSNPPWNGEKGAFRGFAVFDSMPLGIRALCKQLMAYQDRYGIDTVREAITRWAPPSENDTDSYIHFVCHILEVEPDDKLDFHTQSVLFWMVVAIGEQENGADAFNSKVSDGDILAGVSAAIT